MPCNIACTRALVSVIENMVSSPPRRHLDVPRIELRSLLCHKSGRRASSVPYTFHKLANNCRIGICRTTNVTPCSYISVAQSAYRFAKTSAKSLHFFARIARFARSSLILVIIFTTLLSLSDIFISSRRSRNYYLVSSNCYLNASGINTLFLCYLSDSAR